MLPEGREYERENNSVYLLESEPYVVEEGDDDLVEIMQSYERRNVEHEAQEVSVLVIKPDNVQRLVTCDVPFGCDERDILMQRQCEENDVLDDEVVEVPRNEASHISENGEIEEIRGDDDVFIEKIILNQDLLDQTLDEIAEEKQVECEKMEVDVQDIEHDRKNPEEDVISIKSYKTDLAGDNDVEVLPRPIQKIFSDSEEEKEVLELSTIIENCNTSFEEFIPQVDTIKKENEEINAIKMKKGEKEMEDEEEFDEEIREIDIVEQVERERSILEKVREIRSEITMEEDNASFEEINDSESESEKEMEADVETVCLADDSLDDENEDAGQTSGDKTILFIYSMSRGGITVTRDDYTCLSEHEYLNDIIIDFYLNYLMLEVLSPRDRERTHLFSSHFYTRLKKGATDEESANLSPDERRYIGVQRWTKDVNIFQKDFIIVPINEHSHWFLAIICFPKLVDFVGMRDYDCEIEGVESQKPCILIFDSLGISKKTQVAVTLRGYLRHEYMSKMNEEKIFTFINLKTVYPKIPCQQNATDCGLYVLQYVESFFKDPLLDYTLPLHDMSDWFSSTVILRKRERIAKLIAKLTIKYHKGEAVALPKLKFPKPKLLESFTNTSIFSEKSENSKESKSNMQAKKKSQKRRATFIKRPKRLVDTDSESDTTLPANSTTRSKLHISAHNPKPLRRSARKSPSKVPDYFSFDDSEDSTPSTKSTATITSTFLKNDTDSACTLNRKLIRTYADPFDKCKEFSHLTGFAKKAKQDTAETSKTPNSLLKSCGSSTDPFYNLSLDALYNTPKIPPTMSFSQFKIKKHLYKKI